MEYSIGMLAGIILSLGVIYFPCKSKLSNKAFTKNDSSRNEYIQK